MTNQLEALKVSYYALKGENAELKAEVERRREVWGEMVALIRRWRDAMNETSPMAWAPILCEFNEVLAQAEACDGNASTTTE